MITDLRLQNFRSYKDSSFEFSPGVNIIVGPNASGKTNLLEAVLVLAVGRSYRANDMELINFEKPWARLDADMSNGGLRTVKVVSDPLPSKTYEFEGKSLKRLTINHSLPAVLFEPNHLRLLGGSPERRREYLDNLLEQTLPGYGGIRRKYKRTLAQRNNLLKQFRRGNEAELFPWNIRLSQLAGQIVRARIDITNTIKNELGELYSELSGSKAKVTASYHCRWPADAYESQLLKKLETSLQDDLQRGFTSNGPHRDDLMIMFDERPAAEVASRGEVRTAVLALKIIELKLIEETRNKTPLLLLDDVFSELDGKRRHALTDYLARYQTFITTTDADAVIEHFTGNSNVIAISN